MYAWEDLYHRFERARLGVASGDDLEVPDAAREAFARPSGEDVEWLIGALRDEGRKWLVAAVAEDVGVPEALFEPMLDAGIDEVNPSFNRQFIEPCMGSFGPRRVNEYLLNVVATGDDARKAGAVNALYWAQVPLEYRGDVPAFSIDHATPESRQRYLALADLRQRKRQLLLETFVSSTSLDVQRSIIPQLNLDAGAYPVEYRELVERAIEIGTTHADDYVRHRTGVQLGSETLLRPLPHRGSRTGGERQSSKGPAQSGWAASIVDRIRKVLRRVPGR
jgi:hypothetical protein